ncbi:MAG: RNA methyltransferase [Clostridia bacterium]|nr:RNA methyltransferase [Clostridia bacterium]
MIISKQNQLIKQIKALSDKKERDRSGLYIAEGVKLVKEALSFPCRIFALIGTCDGMAKLAETRGERVEEVSEEVFLSVSTEKSPQGVMAVIYKPESFIVNEGDRCLLLDDVQDPNNVGAIIRTAAATGYNTVYLTDNCADPYSPKSVRATMGGIFRVNVVYADRNNLLKTIKKPLIVADMGGENIDTFRGSKEFCLVIGNEGNGVSEQIRKKAKYTVSIPMENGVESLNAAVSAGILMYQLKNSIRR